MRQRAWKGVRECFFLSVRGRVCLKKCEECDRMWHLPGGGGGGALKLC